MTGIERREAKEMQVPLAERESKRPKENDTTKQAKMETVYLERTHVGAILCIRSSILSWRVARSAGARSDTTAVSARLSAVPPQRLVRKFRERTSSNVETRRLHEFET
jgi:hypothetical protein